MVRCRVPAWVEPNVLVEEGERGVSDVRARWEVSVRWHSLSMLGMEGEGRREGRLKE
jgi:hypothetical protein